MSNNSITKEFSGKEPPMMGNQGVTLKDVLGIIPLSEMISISSPKLGLVTLAKLTDCLAILTSEILDYKVFYLSFDKGSGILDIRITEN